MLKKIIEITKKKKMHFTHIMSSERLKIGFVGQATSHPSIAHLKQAIPELPQICGGDEKTYLKR